MSCKPSYLAIMRLMAVLALLGSLGSTWAAPVLEGRTLRYEDGARLVWQRTYPLNMGDLTGPLEVGGATYLGVGPVVYAFSSDGKLLGRADLPGMVTSLDASAGAVLVSTEEGGVTERFTLEREQGRVSVQERIVYPPDPVITGWLARVADAIPQATLAQAALDDPTNPFIAVRQAVLANRVADRPAALVAVRRALNSDLAFPAWVQLAARLDTAGFPAAADVALERARRDAAGRGLDPEVPVSREALLAYGDPAGYVLSLLSQNRLARAQVWMHHLRTLHPRFQGSPELYARYADTLEAQGRVGEADEWREFTRSLRAGTLYNLGPEGLRSVRDTARLAALALALALGAGLLAMLGRAWAVQGEATRELGGRYRSWLRHPLPRARRVAVAYATPSERLTLTLLAAALLVALGGWQWTNQAGAALQSPGLNLGTYGGGWNNAQLADLNLRPGPDAAVLTGLAAQLDGDDGAAREQYTRALPDACALNNLGVIAQARGDEPQARDRYRAALAARPELSAARFNLGLNPGDPELTFQRTYRPAQGRLCYPDQRSLTRATTGDLSIMLGSTLRDPLSLLQADTAGRNLALALLGALLVGGVLAFSLLLPRTLIPAAQSRPVPYRLLSLVFPGTALLSNPWGGMLLLAWAVLCAALLPLTGLFHFPALPLLTLEGWQRSAVAALIGLYVLNVLVFIRDEMRHARLLKREAAQNA